jgi:hypothetical protein
MTNVRTWEIKTHPSVTPITHPTDVAFVCPDIVIMVGPVTFGHSVDSRITEDKLQRIAGSEAKMNLEGYRIAIVRSGAGHIRCLSSRDHVLIYPGTAQDVARIDEPRTLSRTRENSDQTVLVRKLTPASISASHLTRQVTEEPFVPWGDFQATLQLDKMVHGITSGCARPNPGSAGLGAMIR